MWPDEALSPYPTSIPVDSVFRERSLSFMAEESSGAVRISKRYGVTRRKFLGATIAGGAGAEVDGSVLSVDGRRRTLPAMTRRRFLGATLGGVASAVARLQKLASAASSPTPKSSFLLGGDLSVNRLGFGAMRLTGEGIWGWPDL